MIALIAAMDSEVEAMLNVLDTYEKKLVSNLELYEGSIGTVKLLVLKSGVGIGFASMATTVALENYPLEAVVNIGTAGGLKSNQEVLDVVVSTQVVQHNYDALQTARNEQPGLYFEANPYMVELSERIFRDLNVKAHFGMVATGDQFVYLPEQIERIHKYFPDAMCAEMEAGAVAQVCSHYEIPFVVIRSLSDVALKDDSHLEFSEYVKLAAQRSADFTKGFIENWKM